MLGDWLSAAFLCGVSSRTSPSLGRRPLVGFACRWLCSSLDCCWLCSSACCWLCSSACCWLCSSRFISSSLYISVFFSLSSCPCCFTSFFSSFHRRLFWLSFFSESPRGKFRLRGSPSIHRESSLQQRVLMFLRSGLRGSLYLLLVGVLQCHCVMLWTVSPFIMKAYIAASCHCVVVWFARHCRAYRSSCLFLSSGSN